MLTSGIKIPRLDAIAFSPLLRQSLQYCTSYHLMLVPISANPPSRGPDFSGLLTLKLFMTSASSSSDCHSMASCKVSSAEVSEEGSVLLLLDRLASTFWYCESLASLPEKVDGDRWTFWGTIAKMSTRWLGDDKLALVLDTDVCRYITSNT
jgi:hypothetical protein